MNFNYPEFLLLNMLILRDELWNEISRIAENRSGTLENISFFSIDHDLNIKNIIFASEAYSFVGKTLLAIGSDNFQAPPPLQTCSDSLELSDLILGIPSKGLARYPFPVFPIHEFNHKDSVVIYYNIYNLQPDSKKLFRYSVKISSVQLDKNGRQKKGGKKISMIYDLQSDSPHFEQQFSIDISSLQPGKYEFFVMIKDQTSLQEKTRNSYFLINKDSLKKNIGNQLDYQ